MVETDHEHQNKISHKAKYSMKALYSIKAEATGGRNGHVKSADGVLDIDVRMPKALGGSTDGYANPEMLFAAGYSACFDSALNRIISIRKIETGTTTVNVEIGLVSNGEGGFGLKASLAANIPGVTAELAEQLVADAHKICPYSNAIKGNVDIVLAATNI